MQLIPENKTKTEFIPSVFEKVAGTKEGMKKPR